MNRFAVISVMGSILENLLDDCWCKCWTVETNQSDHAKSTMIVLIEEDDGWCTADGWGYKDILGSQIEMPRWPVTRNMLRCYQKSDASRRLDIAHSRKSQKMNMAQTIVFTQVSYLIQYLYIVHPSLLWPRMLRCLCAFVETGGQSFFYILLSVGSLELWPWI